MAELRFTGAFTGNALQQFLLEPDIQPGDEPGYQACKTVLLYHPLGQRLAEKPVMVAQEQERKLAIPGGPEEQLIKAFRKEWEALGADKHIRNTMKLARTYGIASVVYGARGWPTDKVIPFEKLPELDLYFNVVDPMNTAGSLVLNQDPNAPDFQKKDFVRVNGVAYHPSRSCIMLNEEPVYIAYTSSAFGFVGRSVFQRAWYPLKSFVNTMTADDMVSRKAAVLVAKVENAGSITDKFLSVVASVKRQLLKEAQNDNVISIGLKDGIESLNMLNLEGPLKLCRDNILKNIATAADMPAIMLDDETFARGMAEGTEDAKRIATWIAGFRRDMKPLYDYFDRICMWRAWSPAFYETIQAEFPGYKNISHTAAIYGWMNSFEATWPSYIEEPPSEAVKVQDIKQKNIIAYAEVLMPVLDPQNRCELVKWMADGVNGDKTMFSSPLEFDYDLLLDYVPPVAEPAPEEPLPESGRS
jgi:hypothetical protein